MYCGFTRQSAELCDHDGDSVLTIRDDGASFMGVTLEICNLFGENVVADLDKHQSVNWCETVANHLRVQGVHPRVAGQQGARKTSLSHLK